MLEIAYCSAMVLLLLAANVVGLRWVGSHFLQKRLTLWRCLLAALAIAICSAALMVAVPWIAQVARLPWHLATVAFIVGCLVIAAAVLAVVLRLSQGETLKALLVITVASAVVLSLEAMTMRLAFPAYSVPTNSMAPTIRGRHYLGTCQHCSGTAVVSAQPGMDDGELEPSDRSICTLCMRSGAPLETQPALQMGDRIIFRRLVVPRRWNIVVYIPPSNPQQLFTHRLVGLPGETIQVQDGAIWIDGQRLPPPADLAKIRWELDDELAGPYGVQFACAAPLKLADNECFVLGDNAGNSYDSRFFGPVPESDLRGVAGLVYFPPRAWKVFPRY